MPCVSSVSGAAADHPVGAGEQPVEVLAGRGCPARAVRPTRPMVTPSALSVRAIARPIGPEPTTHARVPGHPQRLPVPPLPLPLQLQGPRQVLRHRQDERGDVLGDRLVEDPARVGHHRVGGGELGAHQMVHARARRVHPARPRTLARPGVAHRVGGEVPDQQDVGVRAAARRASTRRRARSRTRPVSRPSRGGGSASRTRRVGRCGRVRRGTSRGSDDSTAAEAVPVDDVKRVRRATGACCRCAD